MSHSAIIKYLEQHVANFKVNRRGKIHLFTCPYCDKQETARFIPGTDKIQCMACNNSGDLVDIAKQIGDVNFTDTNESIMDKLSSELGIENTRRTDELFAFYKANGWDLTPLQKNKKIPFELDWLNKEHKDDDEWYKWHIEMGLNFGVKCGTASGITIVDIDQADIPSEIDLLKGNPLIQKTGRGWHLVYKYVDLATTRIDEYKVDILNNGKQAVLAPSSIIGDDGIVMSRDFVTPLALTEMPEDLLKFLKSKMNVADKTASTEHDFTFDPNAIIELGAGGRTTSLMTLGGILSKELNSKELEFAMQVVNTKLCKPPLPRNEIGAITSSLDRYLKRDGKDLETEIAKYLKIVEFANSREIKDALGGTKAEIDKTLASLVKQQRLYKKGRNFCVIQKAEWKSELNISNNALPFQMPYFGKYANFAWGDLVLLASKTKYGKTTLAMNIIKMLKDQGVKKIYYISSEAGSRFVKTAGALGLVEGDFQWDFIVDPSKITLEDNAVTILDWLLITDKSQTDSMMKLFADQLYKTQGLLIAFQQLKENEQYFAENMVKQYPSLSARYIYTSPDGLKGNWVLDAIREPKLHCKSGIIPCEYDPYSKVLKEV